MLMSRQPSKVHGMKPELLIFDFDGTLVDTADDICETINTLFERNGVEKLPHEKIRPEIGMGLRTLLERTFPDRAQDPNEQHSITHQLYSIYDELHLNSPNFFEGAEKLLNEWKGQVAIISNKPERYVHSILKHLDWHDHHWVDIIGGDTFAKKKPHPMPFEHVLSKAKVTSEKTLMIGDGEPDITGAKNMGIKPIAVEFGYGKIEVLKELGAWKTVKSYEEIFKLAESFSSSE
jgi:HAD superfamily hydrolase (TIGR01549 family)